MGRWGQGLRYREAVVRWRRHPRHRTSRVVPPFPLSRWLECIALLGVALGLVLMHHFVGAHQHTAIDEAHETPAATSQLGEHASGHQSSHGAAELTAHGSAALLHYHPESGLDPATTLAHLCLAAVLAAAVIALLALVVEWWGAASSVFTTHASWSSSTRAPPLPLRLAQLQVLRL